MKLFHALLFLAGAPAAAAAQDPTLSYVPGAPIEYGQVITVEVAGTPGDITFFTFGADREDVATGFGTLGVNPFTGVLVGIGQVPPSGTLQFQCGPPPCDFLMTTGTYYSQAVTFAGPRTLRGISEVVPVDFVTGDLCPPCATDAPVDASIWTCTTFLTAFYLPGCPSSRFDWVAPATFAEYGDGTARLTGEIKQIDDPNRGFCVELNFDGRQSIATNGGTFPPPNSPKLECIDPLSLSFFGGPIDTEEWHYYTGITGTFTGKNDFAGTNYDVVLEGPAAQIGQGGSLKNADYGLSAWLLLTRTSGSDCSDTIHGDINVNIGICK